MKLKNIQSYVLSALILGTMVQKVEAMPMFSTQTGMDCSGCHAQIMPRLNKFGRKFAASGMTLSSQVDDMNINPSLLIKSKFSKTWDYPDGTGNSQGEESVFSPIRMSTFSTAGRINKNLGTLINLGFRQDEGGSISGKIVYVNEIEDGYWGIAAYSVPSFGPFAGMEFYNTGLYKPLRMFDMRIWSNSTQSTKIGTQEATGLQVYFDKDNFIDTGDHFFITMGVFTQAQDNSDINIIDNLLPFARVAYEYPIGNYNFILGAFAINGGDSVSENEEPSLKKESYGLDLQIEGYISDKEALLTLTKIIKNKVEFTGIGVDDDDNANNHSFSMEGAVSIMPNLVLKTGYMTFNDLTNYDEDHQDKIDVKDIDYAINLGIDYGFKLTDKLVKVAIEYAWMNPKLDRVKDYENFMVTFTLPL